jgi:hypothetical protein
MDERGFTAETDKKQGCRGAREQGRTYHVSSAPLYPCSPASVRLCGEFFGARIISKP